MKFWETPFILVILAVRVPPYYDVTNATWTAPISLCSPTNLDNLLSCRRIRHLQFEDECARLTKSISLVCLSKVIRFVKPISLRISWYRCMQITEKYEARDWPTWANEDTREEEGRRTSEEPISLFSSLFPPLTRSHPYTRATTARAEPVFRASHTVYPMVCSRVRRLQKFRTHSFRNTINTDVQTFPRHQSITGQMDKVIASCKVNGTLPLTWESRASNFSGGYFIYKQACTKQT